MLFFHVRQGNYRKTLVKFYYFAYQEGVFSPCHQPLFYPQYSMSRHLHSIFHRHPLRHLLLALLALAWLLPTEAQSELLDRVVAIINDEVITLSEVNEEGRPLFKRVTDQTGPADRARALAQAREEVITSLIDKRLIAQEATRLKIGVSEQEVLAAADRIRQQNNLSPAAFRLELERMGLTEAGYLNDLQNQILQSKLINHEVRSRIVVTDDQVLDHYDEHYTKRVAEGGYYLLQMGFSRQGSEDQARQRAERVRTLALDGQDFGDLARRFSELPSAADGGDIGVFRESDMAPAMRAAITPLSAGQISPIIETGAGFQFFKLISNQQGGIVYQAPYETVKEKIRESLYEQRLQEEFKVWVKTIKESAYIKRL